MSEKQLAVIEKKAHPLATQATSLVIKTEKDMDAANTLLSQMNRMSDRIEEEKNKTYKPAYATVVAIRKQWKPLEETFESAIALLRKNMGAYQTKKVAAARIEEDKIANRVGEGKGKLRATTAMAKIDEIERPDRTVSSEHGATRFDTVKEFKVVDVSKLPVEYILPNEVAIRAAMRRGVELPGVEYQEVQRPMNFR